MNKADITGIILCGGESKRMGMDKARLRLGEKTIIELVIKNLIPVCHQITICTNNQDLEYLPYKKINDLYHGIGPIAGVISGLSESCTEHNIIVSCDTPFIPVDFYKLILHQPKTYDIVLPEFKGKIQSLCGYFRKSISNFVLDQIKIGNHKPIRIFEMQNTKIVTIDENYDFYNENMFMNINTPEDYSLALEIYRKIMT
jgi:molybdopterin-guanine dinucleotide biosynthesis protein A